MRVLLPTVSFLCPAYRAPAMLLAVSSYRPYGYPVRRISGRLPEPVSVGRFAGQKKYRVKSLWFSSSLSHTLTYFFSFYLQKYYIYIIYSLYIYLLLYIVCIYIIFIILYACAREKYFVIQGSKLCYTTYFWPICDFSLFML